MVGRLKMGLLKMGRPKLGRPALVGTILPALILVGCGAAPETIGPRGVDGLTVPTPSPDPADFVDGVDNPWLPLTPGSVWTYAWVPTGLTPRKTGALTMTVTGHREIAGVTTTTVQTTWSRADGTTLGELTAAFAQDHGGNVWLFAEDYSGKVPGWAGKSWAAKSWEAGVGGAEAGLAMLATPRVGDGYRRGYLAGVMEEVSQVVELGATVQTRARTFTEAVVVDVEEGPDRREWYARGVGLVRRTEVDGTVISLRSVTTVEAAER